MLQELAAHTSTTAWSVASMLFFFGIWAGIAYWVLRSRPEEFDARARLVFESDESSPSGSGPGAGTKA